MRRHGSAGRQREQGDGDYAVLGAGVSIGNGEVAGTIVPGYVVGSSRRQTVHGFRTALRADFYLGIFSVELAHEWRSVGGTDTHSLRVTAALDLGIALSWALTWLSAGTYQQDPDRDG